MAAVQVQYLYTGAIDKRYNMTIKYTYEITNVDIKSNTMQVLYQAEGYNTVSITMHLPYESESIEDTIKFYEPINYWNEKYMNETLISKDKKFTKDFIDVGIAGTIEPIVITISDPMPGIPRIPVSYL